MNDHPLDGFDMNPATLEREWVITIDTPSGGVAPVLEALGRGLPLVQGPYDNCTFVRERGFQRFRALEGSHAGQRERSNKRLLARLCFRSHKTAICYGKRST